MKRRGVSWVLYILWVGLTVAAMVVPTSRVPKVFWTGLDKVTHTAMFTVLGALGQAATPWLTLLFSLPLAVALELAQRRITYRTYDTVELLANVIGVLAGVVCFEVGRGLGRK